MRPVNLLPARYRPRTAGSGDSKTAYIALGALALLVLAVFGYVMTANKVSSTKSEIAQARQQIAQAQAQAVTFKDFGDFAAIKESRLTAVKSLATVRLDWERVFRELAHVLPEGVWLTGFDGQVASPTAATGGATDGTGQTLVLAGCADSHRQVADVIVRLRELHVAEDVELTKTSRVREDAGASTGSGGGSETDCGDFYAFDIAITLAAAPVDPAADKPVPASLGGGG